MKQHYKSLQYLSIQYLVINLNMLYCSLTRDSQQVRSAGRVLFLHCPVMSLGIHIEIDKQYLLTKMYCLYITKDTNCSYWSIFTRLHCCLVGTEVRNLNHKSLIHCTP